MLNDLIAEKMKIIESLTQKLGYEITDNDYIIEDLGCPHEKPHTLREGYNAVYIFAYGPESEYEFLKIGKANANSVARFTSQHYGFSAPSTLAKSLCNDQRFTALGVDEENVKEWMLQNLHRVNIYIKEQCGKAATELVESVLHYAFRPRFEGNI